jgi:hypothetical protein
MIDGGSEAAFAKEPFTRFGRIQLVAQDLERHAATAVQIIRFECRPHAARAEQTHDAVMPEFLSGLGHRARSGFDYWQPHRSAWTNDRLRAHAGLEQAARAKLRRQIGRQLGAALRTLAT